jgi:hypothetical protein
MQGKISTYIMIPLFCIMVIICMGAFYSGNIIASVGNPTPAYTTTQTYIGINFFTSINGFIASVNDLGKAVQNLASSTQALNIGGMVAAAADSGLNILKVLLGIPILIGAFIYDIVHLGLYFLPAVAPPELLLVISIATLIPILAILMEIASAIRPPGLAKW